MHSVSPLQEEWSVPFVFTLPHSILINPRHPDRVSLKLIWFISTYSETLTFSAFAMLMRTLLDSLTWLVKKQIKRCLLHCLVSFLPSMMKYGMECKCRIMLILWTGMLSSVRWCTFLNEHPKRPIWKPLVALCMEGRMFSWGHHDKNNSLKQLVRSNSSLTQKQMEQKMRLLIIPN